VVELTGVTSIYDIGHKLKKSLLMFDRIALPNWQPSKKSNLPEYLIADIEYLIERGLLLVPKINWQPDEFGMEQKRQSHLFWEAIELMNFGENMKTIHFKSEAERITYYNAFNSCVIRVQNGYLQRFKDYNSIPILDFFADIRTMENGREILWRNWRTIPDEKGQERVTKSDVIQIVFTSIPFPGDTVPIEQIVDFRSDPESRKWFLSLRNWINDISRSNLSPIELSEKLEWLLSEYNHHMKLHQIKTNRGVLETFITSGTEIVEDLIKIKWSKVAEKLFSIRNRKIELLDAETKSPGQELAYIYKAKNRFS
jgi:hypothetical protein